MSGPWFRTRLVERRDWAPELISLTTDAKLSPFEPGQFIQLGVDLPKGGRIERPYSLASPPGAPPEVLLNRVLDGALTPYLFRLRAGDDLWITTKPGGQFTLTWVKNAPSLWMIATGTGLAPFMSMLRANETWQRFSQIVLVHAVRFVRHFAYRDELDELARARPTAFTAIRVVSRESPERGMLEGRIGALLDSGALEARAGAQIDRATSQVLLAGNPEMIKETRARLEARGLRRNRMRAPGEITTEPYW
jgi:ferredoxin/flavodoxin---NADP+ reductase